MCRSTPTPGDQSMATDMLGGSPEEGGELCTSKDHITVLGSLMGGRMLSGVHFMEATTTEDVMCIGLGIALLAQCMSDLLGPREGSG